MWWSADHLKRCAREIRRDITALALAMRDPRTPLAAKLLAIIVVTYALSPIDLIPDVVPVLGLLDDLLHLPLGFVAVRGRIPGPLEAEHRAKAVDPPR